jgi:hypothetical protein
MTAFFLEKNPRRKKNKKKMKRGLTQTPHRAIFRIPADDGLKKKRKRRRKTLSNAGKISKSETGRRSLKTE